MSFMDTAVKNTLALMARKRLDQAELARLTGESPQNIYNWLKGRKRIPGDKIFIVAKALGVTADDLWGGREKQHIGVNESPAGYSKTQESTLLADIKKLDDESRLHVAAIIRLLANR